MDGVGKRCVVVVVGGEGEKIVVVGESSEEVSCVKDGSGKYKERRSHNKIRGLVVSLCW